MSDRLWRIRVGEREHRVEIVEDEHAAVRVIVDGHSFEIGQAGAHVSRVAAVGEVGAQAQVSLAGRSRPTEAWLAGLRARLEVRTEREASLAQALDRGDAARSGGDMVAPMPGRVVKILVEIEQSVERGRPVMIVEAMKMENELTAPISGVVERIAVAAGDTVDANQILCVIRA